LECFSKKLLLLLKDFTRNLDFFFGGWWVSSVRRTQKNQKQNKKRVLKNKEKKKKSYGEQAAKRQQEVRERGETEARHREREREKAKQSLCSSGWECGGGEGGGRVPGALWCCSSWLVAALCLKDQNTKEEDLDCTIYCCCCSSPPVV